MRLDAVLTGSVLACYFAAALCYQTHLFTGSRMARRAAPVLLGMGVVLHALMLGERWVDPTAPRLSPNVRALSTIAWLLAVGQLTLDLRLKWAALGAMVVPISLAAVFYGSLLPRTGASDVAADRDRMLSPHLAAVILGFCGFALAFCLALVYQLQSWLLKRKQLRGVFRRLPPLESVANGAHWLAAIGFSMLTLGIITGGIAAAHHGGAWYFQPRVITSGIAWLIYATYLAASQFWGWRGRRTTYFLIAGFLMVVATYAIYLQ